MDGLDFGILLDTLADAVVVADRDGQVVYVNAALGRLLGWRAEEITGRNLAILDPEGPQGALLSAFWRFVATLVDDPSSSSGTGGTRRPIRFHVRRQQGSTLPVECRLAAIQPSEGTRIVAMLRDVTDQARLEQETSERAAQLKTLLDHLPVGVAYFDTAGVCRAANGPARRILGRSRAAIAGATAADLFAALPDLQIDLIRCLRECASYSSQAVPWADSQGSSELRYLDWRFEPLPSGEPGRAVGALALIDDVTARRHADEQLRHAMQAAELNARSKTQFLSAVSHDLRTPVNALSLQAELLARLVKDRDDPDGDLAMLTGDMQQAAANLIDLVNDLLELTRYDSGGVEHHPVDFALEGWLERTLNPLEVMAVARGLEFVSHVDRPGRVVRADPVKLGRVLVNLAGNAIKFTETGTVEIKAGATDTGWLTLSVRDTGPGIPQDSLGRIFDEFAQLRNPERDRTKGTGLGLAICRRLVENVGGYLTVESVAGEGSTFSAFFPPNHLVEPTAELTEVAVVSARTAVPVPPHVPGEKGAASSSILLVEDDPYSRKSLCRLMERSGYRVEAVAGGVEAVESVRNCRPALILLDLMLPGMDGTEVLRRVRQLYSRSDLPVVVLSGDVLGGRSSELAALDVDGILAKPVDFDHLLSVVARYVGPVTSTG